MVNHTRFSIFDQIIEKAEVYPKQIKAQNEMKTDLTSSQNHDKNQENRLIKYLEESLNDYVNTKFTTSFIRHLYTVIIARYELIYLNISFCISIKDKIQKNILSGIRQPISKYTECSSQVIIIKALNSGIVKQLLITSIHDKNTKRCTISEICFFHDI